MATPKQEKFIKLLSENLGKSGDTKTLGEIMLEAGYSESMARSPSQVMASEAVQEGISEFVKMLDDKRRLALTKITEAKLEKTNAYQLALVTDLLNKNHELLTGGNTEKKEININVDSNANDRYAPSLNTN